jgi:clan AA aspartic protease (TIGR02281 family)
MPRITPALAMLGLLLGWSAPLHGEIYHWTDAEGRLHFTQRLSDVPRSLRPAAQASARQERKLSAAPGGAAAIHARVRPGLRRGGIQVPFEKNGNTMVVYARINDLVTAPFLVDTGASDVLVPAHVARAAGIAIGADTPQAVYHTANGIVEQPVITLASVAIGEARVEEVRGSVSEGMQIGLLGGTFFNNFTFQVDPGANLITLFPNAEVASGANADEWRARFRVLRDRIAKIGSYLETNQLTDEDRVEDLERRRAALEAELDALELEADRAEVPKAWRE